MQSARPVGKVTADTSEGSGAFDRTLGQHYVSLSRKRFHEIAKDMDGEITVFASADLGAVPFSVKAPDARNALRDLLANKPETATDRLVQRNHGRIAFIGTISLGGPVSVQRCCGHRRTFRLHARLMDMASIDQPERKKRSYATVRIGQTD